MGIERVTLQGSLREIQQPPSDGQKFAKDCQIILDIAFAILIFLAKTQGLSNATQGIATLGLFATKSLFKVVELRLDNHRKTPAEKIDDTLFWINIIANVIFAHLVLIGKDNSDLFAVIGLGLTYGSRMVSMVGKRTGGKESDRYASFRKPVNEKEKPKAESSDDAMLKFKDAQVLCDIIFGIFLFAMSTQKMSYVTVGVTNMALFSTKALIKVVELKLDNSEKERTDKVNDTLFWINIITNMIFAHFILLGKENGTLFSVIGLGLTAGTKLVTVITKRVIGKNEKRLTYFQEQDLQPKCKV